MGVRLEKALPFRSDVDELSERCKSFWPIGIDIESDCDLDTDSDPELLGLYGSLEVAGDEDLPQRVPALAMRVVADSCACPKCDLCESACQGTSSQPHGRP